MDIFKIEVILNKHYPGLTQTDILKMPFYEFSLKLKIIEDNEKEQSEKHNEGSTSTDAQISKYQSMANNMMSSKPSIPNISMPSFK